MVIVITERNGISFVKELSVCDIEAGVGMTMTFGMALQRNLSKYPSGMLCEGGRVHTILSYDDKTNSDNVVHRQLSKKAKRSHSYVFKKIIYTVNCNEWKNVV